jgi:hypothetical protein
MRLKLTAEKFRLNSGRVMVGKIAKGRDLVEIFSPLLPKDKQ